MSMRSIRDVMAIAKVEDLQEAMVRFDRELEERLEPLHKHLDADLLSSDVTSMQMHMTYVESWRNRLVQYLSLVTAFIEHAKSSVFLPVKNKEQKISELERDAFRRKLCGGFVAMQRRLEGMVDCVDSRTNLAKKILGIEIESPNAGRRSAGA